MQLDNDQIDAEIGNILKTLDAKGPEARQSAIESALKLLGNFLKNINDLAYQANEAEARILRGE